MGHQAGNMFNMTHEPESNSWAISYGYTNTLYQLFQRVALSMLKTTPIADFQLWYKITDVLEANCLMLAPATICLSRPDLQGE
jgi:hypothetical protein